MRFLSAVVFLGCVLGGRPVLAVAGSYIDTTAHLGTPPLLAPVADDAWTPASLGSALVGWYIADTGVTESTNLVTGWADLSGQGNNLANGGGTARPTLGTLGGKTVITFGNGSVQTLFDTSFTSTTTGQIFMVASVNTTNTNNRSIICGATSAGGATYCIVTDNTTTTSVAFSGAGFNRLNNAYTVSTLSRFEMLNKSAAQSGYGSVNANTTGSVNLNYTTANVRFYVGQSDPTIGKSSASTSVGEIIVVNRQLTAGELTSMHAYLLANWGV